MNKEEIKARLNQARENTITKVTQREEQPEYGSSLRIADKGSVHCYEFITTCKVGGVSYVVQYNHTLPTKRQVVTGRHCGNVKVSQVELLYNHRIQHHINEFHKYKHYHLNPYTYLIIALLSEGIDLVGEGVVEI